MGKQATEVNEFVMQIRRLQNNLERVFRIIQNEVKYIYRSILDLYRAIKTRLSVLSHY